MGHTFGFLTLFRKKCKQKRSWDKFIFYFSNEIKLSFLPTLFLKKCAKIENKHIKKCSVKLKKKQINKMFHRLLAICQRKQDEDAPCSLLTTVLNRNLFKQINDHIDLLKLASYVPVVTLPLASSTPASASPAAAADFAPFWHRSSGSGGYQYQPQPQPQPQQQQYMFVSSIEEDNAAAAASLFMPFFTLSVAEKNDVSGGAVAVAGGGSSSSSDSDDSDDSDEFGYFEDEEESYG